MITSTIITIIGLIGSLITIYREIYPKDKHYCQYTPASGGLVQGFAPKPLKTVNHGDGSLREPSPDTEERAF